jgi:hypothetical protein
MTEAPYTNISGDVALYLHRIATRKPSSQYQQEQNFIELFRRAGIERMVHKNNLAYYAQHNEDGAGI